MGINFPSSPAVGTLHPDPAQAGIPQYRWDGTAWVAAAGDSSSVLIISDTPPSNPVHGMLWWESDSGNLAVYYDDGSGAQWVQAVAVPMTDTAPADGKFYARQGSVWVEVPRYQQFSLAGVRSFDIQVPTGAKLARVSGCVHASTTNQMPLIFQISVQPGVFRTSNADYVMYGLSHTTFNNPSNVTAAHGDITRGGFVAVASHVSIVIPAIFDGTIQLTRSLTSNLFKASFQSTYWISENFTAFLSNWTQGTVNTGLNVLALRFTTNSLDNWAAESYLNVEWT